ncbi:MAG TPA: ATP-binding cassette domain-containing protein [Candidatus Binatia bacterium]|jgi:ABC-2 type transport system ATP-binding protein|nr:ATP-binding cassette domain-containing protein [Candidatus Binatia bacterium]
MPKDTIEIEPPATAPVLELRNVTKFFGDFKAVDDVNFTLLPGSICGFLGPNGAGKTTTIRMILDILKPSSGSLTVLGHSSALEVRQRIGYLPEEKGLYKKMKTWAVIAYFATLKGLTRKDAKRRAFELLEKYGLKDFAEKPTDALSKGMGQKVQMLASLAHDPEFVILDEPFSGLDPLNQQVMEEIIRDMVRCNRTVLFSTHVMQHAERLCDRILLIAKGKMIFDGTISDAKRTIPRRVRIQTEDPIGPLRALEEVVDARLVPLAGADGHPNGHDGHTQWELELRENADPQHILQTCFAQRIRLDSFNQSEPTLHEVFMRLVGPETKEVVRQ